MEEEARAGVGAVRCGVSLRCRENSTASDFERKMTR